LNSGKEQELKKELGLFTGITIVIGMVIGSGVFFKPGAVLANAGSAQMGLLAWVLGGIITLTAGLTVAELSATIPKTGGVYTYLDEIFGRVWGFLYGWIQTVVYAPATFAALAIIFAGQVNYFMPIGDLGQKFVALGALIFLTALNIVSVKYGGIIQQIATVGKLIPIFIIIIFGFIKGTGAHYVGAVTTQVSGITSGGLGAAILATLWAYDGWVGVSNVAGEMKNPTKDLPKSITIGLLVVLLVYTTINMAFLNVLDQNQIVSLWGQDKTGPVNELTKVLFGSLGSTIIAAGILISIFGALNGHILSDTRVTFAMAERGQFPLSKIFATIHPTFKTPLNAILIQSVIAGIYCFMGNFDQLTDFAVFSVWIFFTLAMFGVFRLRQTQPNLERPYKVPLYPLVPAIALLGGVYILFSTLQSNPTNALAGIGLTLLGIPVYWYVNKNNKEMNNKENKQ